MKTRIFKTMIALSAALFLFGFTTITTGDMYVTRTGHVTFFSTTPIENIEANNYQVSSSLNTTTGDMAFIVLMKSFEFPKAKMQEDFNTDYLETDQYPKATFKGKITNISSLTLTQKGTYTANVEGDLMIHGVTNKVSSTGTLVVNDTSIIGTAKLEIALKDYKISGPSIANKKVADNISINVDMNYKPK